MRSIACTLFLWFACLALPGFNAWAQQRAEIPKDKAELNQEISMRCIYDMAEFGDDAVQTCMRAEVTAADELTRYPPRAQALVDRCLQTTWARGYQMVQVCVEQDLKAEAALAALGPEHGSALHACQEKVGALGPARVKRCVDEALASAPPPK
jgi:hypothetical protein